MNAGWNNEDLDVLIWAFENSVAHAPGARTCFNSSLLLLGRWWWVVVRHLVTAECAPQMGIAAVVEDDPKDFYF
jgi:hypothetical protein